MARVVDDSKIVLRVLGDVFNKPLYCAIAIGVTLIAWLFEIMVPRASIIGYLLTVPTLPVMQKMSAVFSAIASSAQTLSVMDWLIAPLIGINIALTIYYFKSYIAVRRLSGVGMAGVVFGVLGIGCASCGSVVLTSLVGLGVSTHILGILPLKGVEFTLVSVALLIISTVTIALHAGRPATCVIKR